MLFLRKPTLGNWQDRLIQELAEKYHSTIIPVDSEHSAIFQCLTGEGNNPIEK